MSIFKARHEHCELVPTWVCGGCHNRIPRWRCTFSQLWSCEYKVKVLARWASGEAALPCLQTAIFWVYMAFSQGGGKQKENGETGCALWRLFLQ